MSPSCDSKKRSPGIHCQLLLSVNRTLRHIVLALPLALAACSSKGPTPADLAGLAAKTYYLSLAEGKCEAWVDGFWQPDSIPGTYRQQLIDNARMYLAQQQEEHGGIDSVHLVRAEADTARHTGHAYLTLCYGNKEREEIVVPMVFVHGLWMMR